MSAMWQRFTERARRVIFYAQEEAGRLGENYVSTEHLLLGLVREPDSVAARILERMGVSLSRVRSEIERQVSRGEGRLGQETQLTPRAKRVIDLAYDEARQLNNNYIGTDWTGTVDLGNTDDGVDVDSGATNNQLLDNLISGNNSDGIDLGGLTAPNIETNELNMPHITEWHEFQVDSGGAGKFRGGLGVRYSIRFYDEAPFLAVFGDGVENPPFGLYGGHPGTCNRLLVNEGTPTEEVLPAKGMRQLKKGDTYTVYSSGGGGWGDPRERDRAAVLDDVRNGYVSREAAEKVYGVVIRDT